MGTEEKQWVDAAIERVVRASEKGVTVLMVRLQDSNDEADIVVTNATTPEMVIALYPDRATDSDE